MGLCRVLLLAFGPLLAVGFVAPSPMSRLAARPAADFNLAESEKKLIQWHFVQGWWASKVGLWASIGVPPWNYGAIERVTVDESQLDAAFMEVNGPAIEAKVAEVAKLTSASFFFFETPP
mmetsp:Transcript_10427/g.34432  ORF Transcript_10427/g.34432 Transcript_10427/m.34432 type:complete len:120 (+) Transcript_10427:66-425(+)